jgi:WD40 repeat protein
VLHLGADVEHVAFAPDGARLVACGVDVAVIWEWARDHVTRIAGITGVTAACRFVAHGARIVTVVPFQAVDPVVVSDGVSGARLHALGQPGQANSIFVDELADGSVVTASDRDKQIHVWDPDGKSLASLDTDDAIGAAALAPDGTLAFAGATHQVIELWSIPQRRRLAGDLAAHAASVVTIRIAPDGSSFLSASSDGMVRVWDLARRVPRASLIGAANATDARFSSDGERVVVASGDGARVFAAATGRLLARLDGHASVVWSAAFAGDRVVTAGWDGTAQLWRVTDDVMVAEHALGDVDDLPRDIAVAPDRVHLAVARPGAIVVVDARSGAIERTIPVDDGGHAATSVAYLPDGAIAVATPGGAITLFGVDGSPRATLQLDDRGETIRKLAGSPDGRLLAAATQGRQVEVLRLPDLARVKVLAGDAPAYLDHASILAWSPRGELAVAHARGGVDVWTPDLQLATTIPATALTLAFGAQLATGASDGEIQIWDPRTGRGVGSSTAHTQQLFALAWSGEALVSASADHTLRRSAAAGRPAVVMRGHDAQILAADVQEDGRLVVSGGIDQTVRVWDLDSGAELVRIPAHADQVTAVRWVGGDRFASLGDRVLRVWRLPVDVRPAAEIVAEARCLLEPACTARK